MGGRESVPLGPPDQVLVIAITLVASYIANTELIAIQLILLYNYVVYSKWPAMFLERGLGDRVHTIAIITCNCDVGGTISSRSRM